MTMRFTLPVVLSAAFHALVLFGIRWPHVVQLVEPEPPKDTIIWTVPLDPPDEPPVIEHTAAMPKGKPEIPKPGFEDRPSPEPGIFEMPVRKFHPSLEIDVDKIVNEPVGVPGGTDIGGGVAAIAAGLLDNAPRARVRVPPAYPNEARNAGLTGEVTVEFLVDEEGRVRGPRVVRSTNAAFEASTLRAVEKWRFEPGKKNGRTVRFRMAVPVVFNLET